MALKILKLPSGNQVEYFDDSILGEGSNGRVYEAVLKSSDGTVIDSKATVKIPFDESIDKSDLDLLEQKKEILIKERQEIDLLEKKKEEGLLSKAEIDALDNRKKVLKSINSEIAQLEQKKKIFLKQEKESNFNRVMGNSYEEGSVNKLFIIVAPNLGEEVQDRRALGESIYKGRVRKKEEFKTMYVDLGMHAPSAESALTDLETSTLVDTSDSGTFVETGNSGTFVKTSDSGTFVETGNSGTFVEAGTFVGHGAAENQKSGRDKNIESAINYFSSSDSSTNTNSSRFKITGAKDDDTEYDINKSPITVLEPETHVFETDLEETLSAFKKMAQEVERAHNNGILHLDIKGENFLHKEEGDKVTLIDYGEAIERDSDTKVFAVGTPTFMAPELFMHREEDDVLCFSDAQDIYSLGRCFFMNIAEQLLALNSDTIRKGYPISLNDFNSDPDIKFAFMMFLRSSPNLNNIEFSGNTPEITAINGLIHLMKDMMSLDIERRPSIDSVINEIESIQQRLTHAHTNSDLDKGPDDSKAIVISRSFELDAPSVTEEQKIIELISNIEFGNADISNLYLAKSAVNEHNRRTLDAWNRSDPNTRGEAPVDIKIPSNEEFKKIIARVKEEVQANTERMSNSQSKDTGNKL